MKYAFIIGSNAFVVPQGIIRFNDGKNSGEILRVKSIQKTGEPGTHLSVDLDIDGPGGSNIKMINNVVQGDAEFDITKEPDHINIVKPNGRTLIHIRQMDEDTTMALEHNIVAELEVNMPVTAIRIFGDFFAGDLSISAENEKLFINDEGYGTSALAGNELVFTTNGVQLK